MRDTTTIEKETSVQPRMASLGAYVAKKPKSLDPRKFPDEQFELFSVPSHANGQPEVVEGKTVGASKQAVDDDTVLLCKINPRINRTWVVSSHTGNRKIASSEWMSFPPNPDFLPKYLGYYLRQDELREYLSLNASGVGGSLMRAKPSLITNYPFPLFPLSEQRRIVSAIETQLGRLDAAVALLHAAKAKLKRYKQAVLKAAVEGNLGTIPDAQVEATGQEILDRLLNERRAKWNGRGKYKEPATPDLDELPALPDGWAWATVEQFSTKVVDGVHKKPNYVESGVPFVTVRNLTAGPGISFESLKYITEEDHMEFIKRANPEFGDVLISKDGTLGVVRYVDTHKVFSIFVSVAMIKPVDRTMGEYLSVALSSPIVQVQMVPKGSGLQHIHLEDLRADCVPIPPMSIQRWIVEEYNSYETKIKEMETTLDAQLLQSTRLRQAVLKRAFEGRLG